MCTLFSGMQTPPGNALHDAQFDKHSAVCLNQNIIVHMNIHIMYTAENVS